MEGRLVHGDPRDAGTGVCRLPVSQWEAASLPSWGADQLFGKFNYGLKGLTDAYRGLGVRSFVKRIG